MFRQRSNSPFSNKISQSSSDRNQRQSQSPILNQRQTQDSLDDEFVSIMLEVEQKYTGMNKHEKIRIEQWTKKLCQITMNKLWKKNRNNYAKELLLMISKNKLREPFTKLPPEGPIQKFNKSNQEPVNRSKFSELMISHIRGSQSEQLNQSQRYLNQTPTNQQSLDKRYFQDDRVQSNGKGKYHNKINPKESMETCQASTSSSSSQRNERDNSQKNIMINQNKLMVFTRPVSQASQRSPPQHVVDSIIKEEIEVTKQQRDQAKQQSQDTLQMKKLEQELKQRFSEQSQLEQKLRNQMNSLRQQLAQGEQKYHQTIQMQIEDLKVMHRNHDFQVKELKEEIKKKDDIIKQKDEDIQGLNATLNRLRMSISNIGQYFTHFKNILPSNQAAQLSELEQQLSSVIKSSQMYHYFASTQIDTSENCAIPPQFMNESYQKSEQQQHNTVAQPLKNSIMNKNNMSPNLIISQTQKLSTISQELPKNYDIQTVLPLDLSYDSQNLPQEKNRDPLPLQNQSSYVRKKMYSVDSQKQPANQMQDASQITSQFVFSFNPTNEQRNQINSRENNTSPPSQQSKQISPQNEIVVQQTSVQVFDKDPQENKSTIYFETFEQREDRISIDSQEPGNDS